MNPRHDDRHAPLLRTTAIAGTHVDGHTWSALRLAAEQLAAHKSTPLPEPEDAASLARTLVRMSPTRSIAPPPMPLRSQQIHSAWSNPDRSTLRSATRPRPWRGTALLIAAALVTGLATGTVAVHLRDTPTPIFHAAGDR